MVEKRLLIAIINYAIIETFSSIPVDVKQVKHGIGPNHVLVMPEVNVIIVTNVMMRSHYLGKRLTENVKYLGFWEKLSGLEFKTIAARMTSLNQEQTEELLDKLNLHPKEQRYMVRLCVYVSLCVCACVSFFNNFLESI